MALETDDLELWCKEVIEEKVKIKKQEIEEKKAKKKQGFWGSMWGGGNKNTEVEK